MTTAPTQKEAVLSKETRVTFAVVWMIAGSIAVGAFWFSGDRASALSRIGESERTITKQEARIDRLENEVNTSLKRILSRLESRP